MKHIAKSIAVVIAAVCMTLTVNAQQQVNSLYFLDNAVMRHTLNPAFEPWENVYVGLPALGFTSVGVYNNSLMVSDVLTYKDGKTITALSRGGDKVGFYNALRMNTLFNANATVNIVSFGARIQKIGGYWHVGLSEKVDVGGTVPRDLLRLPLFGMERPDGSHVIDDHVKYDLDNFGINALMYTELLLGYSQPLPKNDKWTLGGALKILVGQTHMQANSNDLYIDASRDSWEIDGTADMRFSAPVKNVTYEYYDEANRKGIKKMEIELSDNIGDYFRPHGAGAAIDFGFTWRPKKFMELSASIVDLGGIIWFKDAQKHTYNSNHYIYEGAQIGPDGGFKGEDVNPDENDIDVGDSFKQVLDALKEGSTVKQQKKTYGSMLSAKLNVGFEIYTPNKMIGFGLLSTTKLYNGTLYEDFMTSVNFRPAQWFNLTANYNFMNLKQHAIGASMGLRGGPLSLTVAMDYVPFEYAGIDINNKTKYLIPYRSKGMNVAVGLNLVFGWRRDKDRDGVKDMYDVCPDTPYKQYKKQGIIIEVDENGCPIDEDGDGVPDYLDKCPGTPVEAYGLVDSVGCPLDSDLDGVPDYLDKCPDTPEEARNMVDSVGCPKDSDGDGVPDYIDQCPDTPEAARGYVDDKGCPLDSDLDGVPDYLDQCPDTPEAARATVDSVGCPKDGDQDGVPDYIDQCPDTKPEARAFVDEKGCDKDTDGDGVPDYMDKCPTVPGPASNHGCPENKEIRALFKKAMQGIQFETGKAVIKKKSYGILNQIVKVFEDNPTWKAEVQGHTDITGGYEMNMRLSDARANSVRTYLIEHGIAADRLTAKGYGPDRPIDTNKTKAGRQQNRRVEFDITYEDVVTDENKQDAINPYEVVKPSEPESESKPEGSTEATSTETTTPAAPATTTAQ